ncbi:hypothetical protein RFI_08331 [Reticulomyxa filosa]|uniref:Bromodomain associated domain-containing protein n=1 Tax=Reticulomyxa filosa TaxID=46433 RepID=X6NSQ8_RETFI|nr:hypothetical protein RFI_08331 [Reticulomyxa filosa]|eukprot:ETO28794.1 hypothetical protein RFI_08331 [Reticulomyxa filosa]
MSEEKFMSHLTQMVVSQIAEEIGFTGGIRESALLTLSETVENFIQQIGEESAHLCQSNGRTQVNYFDIEKILTQSLGISMQDLIQFEKNSDPLPSVIDFKSLSLDPCIENQSYIITDKPIAKINDILRDQQTGHTKSGNLIAKVQNQKEKQKKRPLHLRHIPIYCPDFPDDYMYKHTPIYYKPGRQTQNALLTKDSAATNVPGTDGAMALSEKGVNKLEKTQSVPQENNVMEGSNVESVKDSIKTRKIICQYPLLFQNYQRQKQEEHERLTDNSNILGTRQSVSTGLLPHAELENEEKIITTRQTEIEREEEYVYGDDVYNDFAKKRLTLKDKGKNQEQRIPSLTDEEAMRLGIPPNKKRKIVLLESEKDGVVEKLF